MKEPFFHRNNLKDMPSMFVNDSNGSVSAGLRPAMNDGHQPRPDRL